MANKYTLVLSAITTNSLTTELSPAFGSVLVAGNFTVKKLNGFIFEDVAFSISDATTTAATITFTAPLATTDTIVIQATDGTDFSNKFFLDYSQSYTTSGSTSTVYYEMPSQKGTYSLNSVSLNDNSWTGVNSAQFNLGSMPDTSASAISLDKTYLVKFVGQVYSVSVTLGTTNPADFESGNYQIVFDSALQ